MKTKQVLAAMTWALATASAAAADDKAGAPPAAAVKPLFTKALPDVPGKEGMVLTVEYPPGGASAAHRHNANVFVYVLEGAIVMGVAGGKEVTVNAGETFYESPTDVHTVSRNASATQRAKFLVFFVKDVGAPATQPVPAASR
jgi:quercetin dioxygenase-like cupin family protein